MDTMYNLIHKHAKTARGISEKLALNDSHFCSDTLAGFCARGAGILHKLFELNNLEGKLCVTSHNTWETWRHVFNKCGDYFVDITATQFLNDQSFYEVIPKDKVWIGTELPRYCMYNDLMTFDTINQLRDYQLSIGWVPTEIVKNVRVKTLNKYENLFLAGS